MDTTESFSEAHRLDALHAYDVLDTAPEAAFEGLAKAAASVCGAPMSAVSLVDAERQWFKARVGLDVPETPRDVSFCATAMHGHDLFVVPDTRLDPRFSSNRLVVEAPFLRFYAGAPIRASNGAPLGALCVLDVLPRPDGLTAEQASVLRVLADQVEPQLQLRLALRSREAVARQEQAVALASLQREGRLLSALDSAEVGWWDWDVEADRIVASAETAREYGIDPGEAAAGVPLAAFLANVHPHDARWLADSISEAQRTGEPFREEFRLLHGDGQVRWTSARGRCLRDGQGLPARFPGVSVDTTDRKRTEDRLRESDTGRELAMDAARLGRFDHDLVSGQRFYDARALEMFGLTLEEAQDKALVFSRIHPDDRQRVIDAQAAAANPERRGPYREVYRVTNARTGEERWISGVGRSRFSDGVCTRFMGVLEDVTETKRAEAHRLLLVHELNHRVKNTLALVQSLVDASLRGATDIVSVRADIAGRIQALSRAHDLLTLQSWSAASTIQVVEQVVSSLSLPKDRLDTSGGALQLGPKPALQLTLALHELATNALKYGALSNATGRVRLDWGVVGGHEADQFQFSWTETGGPPVSPPARRGFGSRLIERATAAEFDGEVRLDYAPDGVRWRLTAPYAGLADRGRSDVPDLLG